MSSHAPRSVGICFRGVVPAAHPVARPRHALRLPVALGALALLLTAACADTYCQTGPKYGTQCYNVQGQPGYNGSSQYPGSIYPYASNSRRTANGQKP
jgi:hypothetical protein